MSIVRNNLQMQKQNSINPPLAQSISYPSPMDPNHAASAKPNMFHTRIK